MKTVEKTQNGIRVIEIIMEDIDFASDEVKQQRLDICNKCEFIVNNESCQKCSCLLVNRVFYTDSTCPVEKW